MKPESTMLKPESTICPVEALWRSARSNLPTLTAFAVAIASSVVLTLSGCASSAGIVSEARPIDTASIGLGSTTAAAPVAMPSLSTDWWRSFNDPVLTGLIEQSLVGSPNLRVARARLNRAEASLDLSRAADRPQLSGEVDVSRNRFSATGIYPPPLGGGTFSLGTAQLNGSWEIDFFGRNKAALEAAIGNSRAAQADIDAARVVLASNVARTYVQLARLFEQRAVAVRSLQQRSDILTLITQRVQGGLDTTVEQRQGEGSLPESRQQIEQLDEQIAMTRHALAALTVQPPNAFEALTPALGVVQAVPLPSDVPADLIGRRADITAARWRVEAAVSDVKSAKAQFYPNVNLTAFLGFSSIGLDRLLDGRSEQWGVGPAIRLPIFDAGRLRANLRGRTADLDAAVESYNGAVVDAVHEVADQIASIQSIARQQTEQARAQAAAESAFDLSTQRYRAGLGTYLTVLNAEATVLAQRRLAADLKARALDSQVILIRALGGGYTPDAELANRAVASGR